MAHVDNSVFELRVDGDEPTVVNSWALLTAWADTHGEAVHAALGLPVNHEVVVRDAHPRITVRRIA